MSLKRFKEIHPVLKQPYGGHQDLLRLYKQAVLLEASASEMEGDTRHHCLCSTCSAFSTCLGLVVCFILKQSFKWMTVIVGCSDL